jgi:hypothetical protein
MLQTCNTEGYATIRAALLEASATTKFQRYMINENAACEGARVNSKCSMAIQFARARYISRSSGGSAVRSAAYYAREAIEAERTGEVFYFRHRDTPEHHEVLLPGGAGAIWPGWRVMNAAEAAERRKDAQVARDIVLALPADGR